MVEPCSGMVLAAGRGSRLSPLTDFIPKPAVTLFGMPIIRRALGALRNEGVQELHVNLWHLPDALSEILKPEFADEIPFHAHVEEDLLGTAGGVANALGKDPKSDALIYNGDVLYLGGLRPLFQVVERQPDVLAVLGLVRCAEPEIPKSVTLDANGSIQTFLNKDYSRDDAWTFSGIHWISRKLIEALPERGCIVGDLYTHHLSSGRVVGVPLPGVWADLGTLERLHSVYLSLMRDPDLMRWVRPDLAEERLSRGIVIHEEARLAAGVELQAPCVLEAGVHVEHGAIVGPDVYLGAGSSVAAGAHLKQAVGLEGAHFSGQCEGVVAWSTGMTKVPNPELRGTCN